MKSLVIVALPIGAGILAAWALEQRQDSNNASVNQPSYIASETAKDSHRSDSAGGHFVQEPQRRTSLRPDLARRGLNSEIYNQRVSPFVLEAFTDAMSASWKTSVRIMSGGAQVAMGTIVGQDGWIITKASQIPNGDIQCRLFDYRELDAEVVKIVTSIDIALLRVAATDLPVALWTQDLPARGKWVATADLKKTPSSVGVVSTGIQRIGPERPVLGVELESSSLGAAVSKVLEGTGAYEAGLRKGDSIYEVNGIQVNSLRGFRSAIDSAIGGTLVRLKVNRADSKLTIDAQLMDLTDELLDDTEMEVNGRVSARATGFDRVFLHDTVLDPSQCGGPLVNLDGQIVGINIARAGRVTSYALPTDVVKPIVDGLIAEAKLVSRDTNQTNTQSVR